MPVSETLSDNAKVSTARPPAKRLSYHLVTLAGFAVIDWLFKTPFNLVDAVIFLVGLEVLMVAERKLTGRSWG